MDANVIKNYFSLGAFVLLFYVYACSDDNISINELQNRKWKGDSHTSSFAISIKGFIECKAMVIPLIDNSPQDTIILNGEVDTLFSKDLYENELSFIVKSDNCISKNTNIKIKLY